MAVGAYCTYIAEPDLDTALGTLREQAVAETAAGGLHRPGDGTASVLTDQACRVTEGTLLARHLLERAVDEDRPEGPELTALVTAALGRQSRILPEPLHGADRATAAIPVCDAADTFETEASMVDVELDTGDVDELNTLHMRPPSAVRYRFPEASRLDWMVRDATGDDWRVDVQAGEPPALPDGGGFVVHRTDPATGAFSMEPASSYEHALELAETYAEHGFPNASDQAHAFGNPYPEVVTVAAVRYVDTGVEVLANEIAVARREFLGAPAARYVANVVKGELKPPERTGWMLFGLTDLPGE